MEGIWLSHSKIHKHLHNMYSSLLEKHKLLEGMLEDIKGQKSLLK